MSAAKARERGIIFTDTVPALLDGTKTQTRRIVKPQPERVREHVMPLEGGSSSRTVTVPDGWSWRDLYSADTGGNFADALAMHCPYGVAGDRLWVRESHARFSVGEGMDTPVPECVAYRASVGLDGAFEYVNTRGESMRLKVTKWTSPIYMPRWASRITLELTDVRVQRVQDISEKDARAEGVDALDGLLDEAEICRLAKLAGCMATDNRAWFAAAWEMIHGRGAWERNDWVWALSFRRVEPAR